MSITQNILTHRKGTAVPNGIRGLPSDGKAVQLADLMAASSANPNETEASTSMILIPKLSISPIFNVRRLIFDVDMKEKLKNNVCRRTRQMYGGQVFTIYQGSGSFETFIIQM